jgi:hypothetical protein
MLHKKPVLYVMLYVLLSINLLSYAIFDRPSEGGRAEGLDIDYTDPETGKTRRRFAPLEAIFGGHDQTDQENKKRRRYKHTEEERKKQKNNDENGDEEDTE